MPHVLALFQVIKSMTLLTKLKQIDFPTMGWNICRSRTCSKSATSEWDEDV